MPPETVGTPKKPRFFYGWLIVLVSFFGDLMMAGVATHSFGFFVKPMTEAFGWTRAQISFSATLRAITGAVSGIFLGPMLDRYGARPIMVGGAIIAGIGVIMLSRVTALWHFYLIHGIMDAAGLTAIGGLVATTVVAKWFIRKRGRAMAIVSAGLPLGGVILGPLTLYIITNFGWRMAWVVLGILIWVIIIPLAWIFMRRTPEDIGLLPDGEELSPQPEQGTKEEASTPNSAGSRVEEVWTLKEALRTPTLWIILLSFLSSGMGLSATMLHQIAYISDKGLPPSVGATNIMVWGIAAAVGSLFWGFLSERIPVRFCITAAFIVSAAGLFFIITANTIEGVLIYSVIHGIGAGGSSPLDGIITANYYGRRFIGTIRGVLMPLRLISTGGGPLFAAYIYDTTRSYDLAFIIFAVAYLLGGILILFAPPPKHKEPTGIT
ncbi:MAG: MFS transporter [Dehalococcoidales bacterium]|nr:MFS transporter [Dehalococcoidales bacterium]